MNRKLAILGIAVGAILALGPIWGMVGTAIAVERSFTVLTRSPDGRPSAASWNSGAATYFRNGLIACPIGIALGIFSIIKLRALDRKSKSSPRSPRDGHDFSE